MNTENAGHSGNEFLRRLPRHHKYAVAAPPVASDKAGGEGNPSPAESVSGGTTDIVFLLSDGQIRQFDADMTGQIMSNVFFESHPHKVRSIHFGQSCYIVRNGQIQQFPLRMTREEFIDSVNVCASVERRGGGL